MSPPEPPAETAAGRSEQLVKLLDVELQPDGSFLGSRQPGGRGRVFGGQVIAQGLMAAMRTVAPDRICHSLHAYFMRGGDEDHPIQFRVDQDFDGGSFTTRRVTALQDNRPILTMGASFQRYETGLEHQDAMPDVPSPEELPDDIEQARQALSPERFNQIMRFRLTRPIEMRWVEPHHPRRPAPPVSHVWLKLAAPVTGDANLHRAILAYASDMALLGTSTRPHAVGWEMPNFQSASLDHILWIHDEVDMNDWLLYAMDSPWAARGRGFNRGRFYTRDGRLVASVAQEGLIRLRRS